MKVMIAGGSGFLGTRLACSLLADGHAVWIVGRRPERMKLPPGAQALGWDGRSPRGWGGRVSEMDAVVNLAGATIGAWPWTAARKRLIVSSRVDSTTAVAQAIESASPRPRVLIQASGIGHYGPCDDRRVTEDSPAGDDYLAGITKQVEPIAVAVEKLGVRGVIIRSAPVLAAREGVLPLMALPVRLFAGGPLGNGRQGVPWIHVEDEIAAIRFLIENTQASGAYNLVAPNPASNADFMRAVAKALKRPYWLPAPAFALKLALGGMSVLLLDGQYAIPKRLLDMGFTFKYPDLQPAVNDIFA